MTESNENRWTRLLIVSLVLAGVGTACVPVVEDGEPPPPPTLEGPNEVSSIGQSVIVNSAACETDESNGDGTMSEGESTEPDFAFSLKPELCSEPVEILTEVCLVEQNPDQTEEVTRDGSGNVVCATWTHRVDCVGQRFSYSDSSCEDSLGAYCDLTFVAVPTLPCGWKIRSFEVRNAVDDELLEFWEESAIRDIVYELLPPG